MPQRCMFLDTETKPIIEGTTEHHYMDIAWTFYYRSDRYDIHNGNNWKYHNNRESLWRYITSYSGQQHPLYLFGHNLYFDLQASGFFDYLTSWGWVCDFVYDKGLSYILTIKKDKRQIKCVSTTNFFGFSLKDLGDIVGVKKIDIDLNNAGGDERSAYCRNDVRILVLAMVQYWTFLNDHDLGNFALTRASQSMHAFKHRFMKHEIVIHDDERIIELERSAYFGGRVEAFYIGELPEDDYVSLDINSMYPYVMQDNMYPIQFIDYRENYPIKELDWVLNKYMAIAEVELETDEPAYAKRQEGKLIFPVGKFTTGVSTPGLIYAHKKGHLRAVHKIALYRGARVFNEWVKEIYPLKAKYKEEKNQIYVQIVKILLNSLYGKFGQTEPIEEKKTNIDFNSYYRISGVSLVTGEHITETYLMNKQIYTSGSKSSKNAFVSIPAHVTEYARFLLWDIMKQVGLHNVLYIDTDSIKIPKRVLANLKYPIDKTRLGALELEYEFTSGAIFGAKDYRIGDKVTLKGIPKKAVLTKDGVYHYPLFPGQSTHLRLQVKDHYLVEHTEKRLSRVYSKGIVTKSGLVRPIELH